MCVRVCVRERETERERERERERENNLLVFSPLDVNITFVQFFCIWFLPDEEQHCFYHQTE